MSEHSTATETRTRARTISARASRTSKARDPGAIKSINKAVAILREIHTLWPDLRNYRVDFGKLVDTFDYTHEQVAARNVSGDVNRPRSQRAGSALRVQRALTVDAKGGDAMLVANGRDAGAGVTGAAIAPGDIQEWRRRRSPGFLHEAWQHQRRLASQRAALRVHAERNELFADARVEGHLR